MAFGFSLQIPVPYLPKTIQPNISLRIKSTLISPQFNKSTPITTSRRKVKFFIKAIEEEGETVSTQQSPPNEPQPTNSTTPSASGDGLSELGSEIKKAMKERQQTEGKDGDGDFWSGVREEIGEIEWPAFGKVLGTTGVVIGVIAGSSVVLLTVNAVLAELSDRVFAGKGVQDFFS
uniref:Putative preprotein translocase subunit SECE1 n=1 Tax=Davidia involucrata TaxID=16924 RepID=A0A5B7B7U9_DAVIN